MWGQSPLGVFNELTPLNHLFASSYENSSESVSNQTFDVKSVKNGLNFCVFVDESSGMTYQIGAENLIDPYIDDALVSLSELRDARFSGHELFACGANFVIGQSLTSQSFQERSTTNKSDAKLLVEPSPAKMVSALSPMKRM